MRVILLTDVKKVGVRGALVTVADGYAQNVLIPRKLATPATPQNVLKWEREREGEKEREAKTKEEAKKLLASMDGKTVTIQAKANETGGLFVAIHTDQVADAIKKQLGVSIAEDAITFPEQIKKLGEFRAEISMQTEKGEIKVEISKL